MITEQHIRSIAIPALGCGNGGLDWADVRPLIERKLADLDLEVRLYVPASITCPDCGTTSYNAVDVREGYCNACHDWTSPTVHD